MSDIQVNEDGTISEAEAGALERAVLERLQERLRPSFEFVLDRSRAPECDQIVTTTLRVWEPPA